MILVAKRNLKFESKDEKNFVMKGGTIYAESNIPAWVLKSNNYKGCVDSDIIQTGKARALDADLVKKATSLEITFDAGMVQSVLEQKVEEAQTHKNGLIEADYEAGVDAKATMKISTLETKVEEL